MTWYSLAFNAGRERDLHLVLRAGWTIAYANVPLSFRNGVFRRSAESGGVIVYFSPRAHELAEAFGATACSEPPIEGLGLLVGDKRTWAACFSESPKRLSGTLSLRRRVAPATSDDFTSTFATPIT